MRISVQDLIVFCTEEGLDPSDVQFDPSYIRYKSWSKINGKVRITVGPQDFERFDDYDDDGFYRYSYDKSKPEVTKIPSND